MTKKKHVFIITVFLLVAVFILGILIGRWVSSSKVGEIELFIKNNELNTESYLIEQELISNFEQGSCGLANARISSLSTDLWKIGQSLSPDDAEQRLGVRNYYFLKMKYHLMQIRTYILMHELKQNCNNTDSVVLFYFSKNEEDSAAQGEILDQIVEDYGVNVFAIEYNYSAELNFLEEYYSISETPSLIIDYDNKFSGLTGYQDIEKAIKT